MYSNSERDGTQIPGGDDSKDYAFMAFKCMLELYHMAFKCVS